MKQFNYFENHGNEDGTDNFTIVYGDPDEMDHIIVGAEDDEDDAKEACKRLEEVLKSNTIQYLERAKQEVANAREADYSHRGEYEHDYAVIRLNEQVIFLQSLIDELNKS